MPPAAPEMRRPFALVRRREEATALAPSEAGSLTSATAAAERRCCVCAAAPLAVAVASFVVVSIVTVALEPAPQYSRLPPLSRTSPRPYGWAAHPKDILERARGGPARALSELRLPYGPGGAHMAHRGERIKRAIGPHNDGHHPQRYAPLGSEASGSQPPLSSTASRRRVQSSSNMLSEATTAQIKIMANYDAMYKDTAVPYSACFEVGDWFKWNFPTSTTPPCANPSCNSTPSRSDGTSECHHPGPTSPCGVGGPTAGLCDRGKDPSAQDCWGMCLEEDVLTDAGRSWMMAHVEDVIREVQTWLRVRRRAGNTVFVNSEGLYKTLYKETPGVSTAAECAKDARTMYRMPVPASYCQAGVDADVVFFPYQSQYVPNVAGFGGDMGKDQYGRPVLITMGWGVGDIWGTNPKAGSYNGNVAGAYPDHLMMTAMNESAIRTVKHEIVHGLGFNIFQFQNTYDTSGKKKDIVLLGPMVDKDGASDQVRMLVYGDMPIAIRGGHHV
jgi:hypothetical protein